MSRHHQSCAITKSNNDFSGKRANEDLEYTSRTPVTMKLNDYAVDEDDIASSRDASKSNCSLDDSSRKVVDVHHSPPHSLTIKDSLENILKIHKIEVSTRRDFLRLIRYSRLCEHKINRQSDVVPKNNDKKKLMCNLTRSNSIVDNVFQRRLLCAKEKIAFPESSLNSTHRGDLRFPRLKFHRKPQRMNSRRCAAVMHNISNLMENLRLDHSSGDDDKMIALFSNKCKFGKRSVRWKSEVDVIYYNGGGGGGGGGGANDSKYKGIDIIDAF